MELKYLVIHCTATVEGREITADDIHRMHCSPKPIGRGWKQVGYSTLIHLDGRVETLVGYNEDNFVQSSEITNGATGFNSCSRHVVYAGGLDYKLKPKNTLTDAQHLALSKFIKEFLTNHPDAKVLGHRQIANKACPCFDVAVEFSNIIPIKNRYEGLY